MALRSNKGVFTVRMGHTLGTSVSAEEGKKEEIPGEPKIPIAPPLPPEGLQLRLPPPPLKAPSSPNFQKTIRQSMLAELKTKIQARYLENVPQETPQGENLGVD